jgi:hypothetical protein
MRRSSMKEQLRTRWWLWLGSISYVVIVAYSIASGGITLDSLAPLDALEWLAASVPYFFYGALFGWCIDWALARRADSQLAFPEWGYAALAFIAISIAAALLFATSKPLGVRLLFPLAYGVFFVVFASQALFRGWADTLIGRATIDIAFLLACGAWLWLQIQSVPKYVLLRRVLMSAILLFLTIGAVSCAVQIG